MDSLYRHIKVSNALLQTGSNACSDVVTGTVAADTRECWHLQGIIFHLISIYIFSHSVCDKSFFSLYSIKWLGQSIPLLTLRIVTSRATLMQATPQDTCKKCSGRHLYMCSNINSQQSAQACSCALYPFIHVLREHGSIHGNKACALFQ